MRARDAGFDVLIGESGLPIDDAWRAQRRDQLLQHYQRLQPDILITETYPFGRRQFTYELDELLDTAHASNNPPLIAASVRDILVRKDKLSTEQWMANQARGHYDRVLVHADPSFVRLEDSFPFADQIDDLVSYTGYIHGAATDPESGDEGRDEILVSCGGGAVGRRLLDCAMVARSLSKAAGDTTWRLLIGHDHADATLNALQLTAPRGIEVERARPDFPTMLKRCRASVSQAGYNTVMDILIAGCPAVYVPFAEQGQTEQQQRAKLLEDKGRAVVADEATLSPDRLAEAVDEALMQRPAKFDVDVDGAATSADILLRDLQRKRAGVQ